MSKMDPQSRMPLHEPEFHSTVPPHLAARLSESEQHQVHTMSRLEEHLKWLSSVLHAQHATIGTLEQRTEQTSETVARLGQRADAVDQRTTEFGPKIDKLTEHRNSLEVLGITDKVVALWEWKSNFTGRLAILWVIGATVGSLLLSFVGNAVMHYLKVKP